MLCKVVLLELGVMVLEGKNQSVSDEVTLGCYVRHCSTVFLLNKVANISDQDRQDC